MSSSKTNFYIFTGGPGGGKSTLLQALVNEGFVYIDETARDIIKQRILKGMAPRPSPKEFATQIFELDVENYVKNIDSTRVIFFDRAIPDSACMVNDADPASFQMINQTLITHRYNSNVFITPPWQEIYQNDAERDQSFEESIQIYLRLFDWYSSYGYNVVELPKASVELRLNFVINQIKAERAPG